MTEFVGFPKIARFNREIVVTEKIDGTNGQVVVNEAGDDLYACSRNRIITPDDDNHGFARWVADNKTELLRLGPGHHYGEWWGHGIQHGYGLPKGEKRWSLFNVGRWGDDVLDEETGERARPACCGVVPTLYRGIFNLNEINRVVRALQRDGSAASPGCMRPEGVVIYHTAARQLFKWTFNGDGVEKRNKGKTVHDYLPGEAAA